MSKSKYCSFKKAHEFVLKLGLKNRYEWAVYCHIDKLKPADIPANPDEVYKKWDGWKNWLGYKEKTKFLPFNEARELVRQKGLESTLDWKKWCNWDPNDIGLKPPEIPASPHIYYKDKGWAGYNDWIGSTRNLRNQDYMPFDEARKFARSLGLTSSEKWLDYCKGKMPHLPEKPLNIPTNVARTYTGNGWNGMNDFLDAKNHRQIQRFNNARPFEEAREFVHSLGIKNLKMWHKYIKNELQGFSAKPKDIPNSPELIYKGHGWAGYGDWFGTFTIAPFKRSYRDFESAREFARGLGLTSSEKWIAYCKGDMPELPVKPDDIPTNVARKYENSGWKGYKDFLMSNIHRQKYSKFRSYEEAKAFVATLKLKDYKDWHKYIAGKLKHLPEKPKDIPANPSGVYADKGWIGIGDFIGSDAFPYAHMEYRKHSEARKFVRTLGLTSSVEWVAYCKDEYSHLPAKPIDIPANVVRKYENKGWKGFKDFLWSDKHRKHRRSFMSYAEAKAYLKENGIKTEKEFEAFRNSNKRPDNFPLHPSFIYQRKGWTNLKNFLA